MLRVLYLMIIFPSIVVNAQYFYGKVVDEDKQGQFGIRVYNMRTVFFVETDQLGDFNIDCYVGDELMFISRRFLRTEIRVREKDINERHTKEHLEFVSLLYKEEFLKFESERLLNDGENKK